MGGCRCQTSSSAIAPVAVIESRNARQGTDCVRSFSPFLPEGNRRRRVVGQLSLIVMFAASQRLFGACVAARYGVEWNTYIMEMMISGTMSRIGFTTSTCLSTN